MLRLYSVISVFCFTLTISSCSTWRIKNEIEFFCKEAIVLPSDMELIQNNNILSDSLKQTLKAPIKLILYFSTDRCTSCVISRLRDYEKIFQLKVEDLFSPLIIFSPKEDVWEYKAFITNLKLQSCLILFTSISTMSFSS